MTQAANDGSSEHPAASFIAALFSSTTEQPVFFQSLANDARDQDEARYKPQLLTRDIAPIGRFITRHDRARRGLFFCVATVAKDASTRSKETVRETIGLHADIDFKSVLEDEPTIRARLDRFGCPATVRVRSGGGLHLYWLFRESVDSQVYRDPLEVALKALAGIVAGDPAVCEVSRLMRLPGTHNSKYGDMREVVCERLDGPRYELDELEEWILEQQPILTRKGRTATGRVDAGSYPSEQTENGGANAVFQMREQTENDNPFAAFARQTAEAFGYKPRLDVDAMLAAMGDGNIHNTQVRAAASMISTGQPPEEVVQILMEATRRVAGPDWDWRLEERTYVRPAVDSAVRKFAPAVSREAEGEPPLGDDNVVNFGDAKTHRKPRQTIKDGDKVDHIDIGTLFLEGLKPVGQAVMFTEKGNYCYEDGLWRLLDDKSLKAWLDSRLESCVRLTKAKSNNKIIGEARAWIIRHPGLQKTNVQFDRHGLVPTRSGLVNPTTGVVQPSSPGQYCTWRIESDYDPSASCPYWLQMLEYAFSDRTPEVRAEYVQLLQETLGMGLVDIRRKSLSKATFFVGGSNYGKSGLIGVMAGLFGEDQNNTPLSVLENPHGTMPFVRRIPWVLDEAGDQSKWHTSSTFKAIISGDGIQINMKGGKIFKHRFTGPVFLGSNSPPQFKEATEAIINRIIVVECRRKFDENETVGADAVASQAGFDSPATFVLATELAGLLAWAMEGLRRALARKCFILPADSLAAAEAVRRDSNLTAGFVEECISFDPDMKVTTQDFCAAFSVWWLENKGENRSIPSNDSIGRALAALGENRIAIHPKELKVGGRRHYAGLRLNPDGVKYWERAVESSNFEGKTASTTPRNGQVNTVIPASWDGKLSIRAMRKAQGERQGTSPRALQGHYSTAEEVPAPSAPNVPDEEPRDEATDRDDEIPF